MKKSIEWVIQTYMEQFRLRRIKSEIKNERNKIHSRWLFIFIVLFYFTYILEINPEKTGATSPYLNWNFIGTLVIVYSMVNILITIYLNRVQKDKWQMHPIIKYLTMSVDILSASLVILATGGEQSIFFLLYIIIMISNCIRYGLKVGIIGLFILNLFYVASLAYLHYPEFLIPGVNKEILKIIGLWIVGIYTGYLSRRFEVLQMDIDKYQDIINELLKKDNYPGMQK